MRVLRLLFTTVLSLFIIHSLTAQEIDSKKLEKIINSNTFELEITRIIPMGMKSESSVGEYSLKFEKGVLTTYLPYRGKSTSISYSNVSNLSIEIKKEKVNISKKYNEKKKKYELSFRTKDSNSSSTCDFYIEIFENGQAVIRLSIVGRDPISYNGQLNEI